MATFRGDGGEQVPAGSAGRDSGQRSLVDDLPAIKPSDSIRRIRCGSRGTRRRSYARSTTSATQSWLKSGWARSAGTSWTPRCRSRSAGSDAPSASGGPRSSLARRPRLERPGGGDQQFGEAGRVRIQPVRELPEPSAALRRQTGLRPPRHSHTPLKRGGPHIGDFLQLDPMAIGHIPSASRSVRKSREPPNSTLARR